jgi:hypothetical protein
MPFGIPAPKKNIPPPFSFRMSLPESVASAAATISALPFPLRDMGNGRTSFNQ